MTPAKFQYLHATVDHCLTRPLPSNVTIWQRDLDEVVYTVDLPASVWAAVVISTTDKYDNTLSTFPSSGLRRDWLERYAESRSLISP